MPKGRSRLTADCVLDLVCDMEGVEFAECREVPSIGGFDPFLVLILQFAGKEHEFELHDSLNEREVLRLINTIAGNGPSKKERLTNEDW